jgi:hypothetical protein
VSASAAARLVDPTGTPAFLRRQAAAYEAAAKLTGGALADRWTRTAEAKRAEADRR